jgi:putative hydrolase
VTDNLFDRLRRLLEARGPVNWGLAREIAESVAGPAEPVDPWVAEELTDLAHAAALRVSAASPLDAAAGEVRAADRRTWAATSVAGFAYLAEPLAAKMGSTEEGEADPLLAQLGPALVGMQMGSMAGFLSHRVLAGFDVGLPVEDAPATFVVPNIAAFTADHGLEERQTRLWLALHETTHRATMALPWMRRHLRSLTAAFVDGLRPDPAGLQERLEALQDPEHLEGLLADPSALSGLTAGPEAEQTLRRLQALMAVLEGYAEWLVGRAAPGLVPEAPRLREAIDRRRAEPSPGEQMLQRMLGLDLQHHHYRRGTAFCEEVARRWGEEALSRLWVGPEALPTSSELEDPVGWAARVLL